MKKPVPVKNGSLGTVLNQSKKIKNTVTQAATDLTSVNEVLSQGNNTNITIQDIKDAITQNENVELTVSKAASDLNQVNADIAREVTERAAIESELADTQMALAEVRDDLLISQANEEDARKAAFQDPLTGLPNRLLFEQNFENGLAQAKRHNWKLAVLFIDIDNFKTLNDTHGHDIGDKALQIVANRLQSFVRKEDTVSRWGGDEFVCLLLEVKETVDVVRLAEKMVDRIAEPCDFSGRVLTVKVSIGIAIYPLDGITADSLFKNADTAMYQAKHTEHRVVLSGTSVAVTQLPGLH